MQETFLGNISSVISKFPIMNNVDSIVCFQTILGNNKPNRNRVQCPTFTRGDSLMKQFWRKALNKKRIFRRGFILLSVSN